MVESSHSSAVLRRTGTSAGQAKRIDYFRIRVKSPLQYDIMFPAVTEVVFIQDLVFGLPQNVKELDAVLGYVADVDVGVRNPVERSALDELMQVRIAPAHNRLKQGVKLAECSGARHVYPAPDRRSRTPECDLELVDWPDRLRTTHSHSLRN